jgi:hypothetical protein
MIDGWVKVEKEVVELVIGADSRYRGFFCVREDFRLG